jgi:hypothetical protein
MASPCASPPNSLAAEICQFALVSGLEMSCWYSIGLPVTGCATVLVYKYGGGICAPALCVCLATGSSLVSPGSVVSSASIGRGGTLRTADAGVLASRWVWGCRSCCNCCNMDLVGSKSSCKFGGSCFCHSAHCSASAVATIASCTVSFGKGS